MINAAAIEGARVVVTGPTGQVALPIARALAGANEVWGIARFRDDAGRQALESAGVRCVAVDLLEGDLAGLPADVDYVLHFAVAKTSNFDKAIAANAEATGLLMSHFRSSRAFFVCSSGSVYQPNGGDAALKESDPLGDHHRATMPTYSISKIASEAVARTCARVFDLPTVIARLNVPYGDNGGWPLWHLLMMEGGVPIPLEADGPNRYCPIHEDDMLAMLPALLDAAAVPATIVNWAGDEIVTAEEWCRYIGELAGVEPRFEASATAIPSVVMDTTRLRELAPAPTVHWRDGIRRMLDAHMAARSAGRSFGGQPRAHEPPTARSSDDHPCAPDVGQKSPVDGSCT